MDLYPAVSMLHVQLITDGLYFVRQLILQVLCVVFGKRGLSGKTQAQSLISTNGYFNMRDVRQIYREHDY